MEMNKVTWPGWETVRVIGRGSFGTVYEIQRKVGEHVSSAALKVIQIPQKEDEIAELRSEGYDNHSLRMYFADSLRQIENEYALLAELKGHANVVYCDDIRSEPHSDGFGWNVYLKMELLTPLKDWLEDQDPAKQAIALGRDICNALAFCQKNHVIHRDIKPENIFIARDGNFKLGDFGIAKTMDGTSGGTVTGTYEYMSPEVYQNRPYNASADIYSLGLVMYWMLNERTAPFLEIGKKPTPSEIKAARSSRFDGEPIPAPKNGSEQLKRIVLKACAYDPEDRYASAQEMLDALNALVNAADMDASQAEMTIGPNLGKKKKSNAPRSKEEKKPEVEEKTVGPMHKKASAVGELAEHTVGPVLKKKEDHSQQQKKARKPQFLLGALVLVAALVLLLLMKSCGGPVVDETVPPGTTLAQTEPSQMPEDTTAPPETTVPEETLPVQSDWSQWMDGLPEYVTSENYVIEEQMLYSTQKLEKTSSTQTNSMEGWTLVDTISSLGEYGPWSEWSANKVDSSDTRNVEKQTRYRYKTKETTTSSSSTKSGWELYDTTYSWGDYGNWSNWSTTMVSGSNTRQVETKTQYSYRDKWVTQEYSDWSGWSNWSWTRESTSDLKKEESKNFYGYYYFQCRSCGAHMPYSTPCETWGGGCGATNNNYWNEIWSATSWDDAGLYKWHGTRKLATYNINGSLTFKWDNGDGGPKLKYRYATRTLENVTNYGSWSEYTDTVYTSSSTREVRTRTVYRYRDREQIPTYHFYRWGGWSDWSTKSVSENSDRKVETKRYYRYQDKITETTYCFERWTDWSDYGIEPAVESDELKVQTKKQYRYRSKTADEKRNPYTDIDATDLNFDAVMWVSENGIMNGTSAETFAPNGTITRGQMVMLLWRSAGKPAPAAAVSPFKDVEADSPYIDAVLWATQEGIAGGESADLFGVNSPCIRGQAITFLYRAAGKPSVTLSQEPFADVNPGDFFYDAVLWAYANNVSSGISTTEFGVSANCTRIQVAVMLYRAFGK